MARFENLQAGRVIALAIGHVKTLVRGTAHATITYSLVNPPAGMTISTGGVIIWTPTTSQAPSTNTIVAVATSTDLLDSINPVLTTTNTFKVIVKPIVILSAPTMLANGWFAFSFNTTANASYTIEYSNNLTVWMTVFGFVGDGSPVTLYDPNAGNYGKGFYRVRLAP